MRRASALVSAILQVARVAVTDWIIEAFLMFWICLPIVAAMAQE